MRQLDVFSLTNLVCGEGVSLYCCWAKPVSLFKAAPFVSSVIHPCTVFTGRAVVSRPVAAMPSSTTMSVGVVKVSKKQLKARAARFAHAELPDPPPKRVFAHSEGVVYISDPKQKLLDLCKRKVAAGEALSDLQYDALLRYGVDPGTVGARRAIVGLEGGRQTAGGTPRAAAPRSALGSGHKRARAESAPSAPTPVVVLRPPSMAAGGSSGSGSNSASTPTVLLRNGSTGGGAVPPGSLLDTLPTHPKKRSKVLRQVIHRLRALSSRQQAGETLTATEEWTLAQFPAVTAEFHRVSSQRGGHVIDVDEGDD